MKNLSIKIKKSKLFENVYDFPFINKMNSFSLLKLILFPKFFLKKLEFLIKDFNILSPSTYTAHKWGLISWKDD